MHFKYIFPTVIFLLFISSSVFASPPPHVWSAAFGDPDPQEAQDIDADHLGNSVVVGRFAGTVDFGGGPLTCAGYYDVFIAKFDPAGNHIWSQRFGGGNWDDPDAVTVDDSGNVVLAGFFMSPAIDFGGGMLTNAGGSDAYVAKFDASGGHVWSSCFGDAESQYAQSVATDAGGNIIVAGFFAGSIDFGGGPLTSAGGDDIYLAKLGPNGGHIWSKRFGDANAQGFWYAHVDVDDTGNIILNGEFENGVDFGGGTLTSAGSSDIFLAKFDGNGNHLWSRRYGDASGQMTGGMAVNGSGSIYLTGSLVGTVDFGGGPVTSSGGYDIYVAGFDPGGNHMWSGGYGDPGRQQGWDIAADESGSVVATGRFKDTVDFGGGAMTSAGGDDIYLVRFDAAGGHVWSRSFGDTLSSEFASGVAIDGGHHVHLTGYFGNNLDFGGGPLMGAGYEDVFVAKFGPDLPYDIPVLSREGYFIIAFLLIVLAAVCIKRRMRLER